MGSYILKEKVITSLSAGEDFATVECENILASPAGGAWTGRRVFWSGWMGDSIHALDFKTWSTEAWLRLDRWCDELSPALARSDGTACFHPHPRHLLSDPQSCVSFLKRRAGQPFEVLLDPTGFLTPTMLSRAADHIARALDALVEHDGVPGVVIANVQRSPGNDELLTPAPLDEGLLDTRLPRMIAERVPATKPRIFIGPDAQRQARALQIGS